MRDNPYTLTFGKDPAQSIPRTSEIQEVLETFMNEPPTQQIYMITGVRGCGKTVFMTEIEKELRKEPDWETVELSSSQDMLMNMAQLLNRDGKVSGFLKRSGLNLSAYGVGVKIDGKNESVPNPRIAVEDVLSLFRKKKKKLLICIDEVVSNDYVKEFASVFQILVREDYPVYLLMTGLYENINELQNEKNLTFLYRAPEIKLGSLNTGTIAENYSKVLNVPMEDATRMATLTKGYSFAFQVLGYFTYRHEGDYKAAVSEYRQYLEDYVYGKIWSEMSKGDRRFLYSVARSSTGKAAEIKKLAGYTNGEYTPYRDRLLKKRVITGEEYGYVRMVLPLFDEYVIRVYEESEIQ